MGSKFTMTGYAEMKANLERIKKGTPGEVARALTDELRVEAREVRARTPVRTGKLRDSVTVPPALYDLSTRKVTGSIVAGAGLPYALYVHEDLDAFHRIGQAKFLESVLMESGPYLIDRVGARIDLNRLKK